MKAQLIYVIEVEPITSGGVADDAETRACAEGLSSRYGAPHIKIAAPANPTASQWQQYFKADPTLAGYQDAIGYITGLTEDVGVYVVGHGGAGIVAGLRGNHVADLLEELGFQNLRKVCVVACSTGKIEDALDTTFFGLFCKRILPLCPMVAAYSGYVTVANENNTTINSTKQVSAFGNSKGSPITQQQFDEMKENARKIISSPRGPKLASWAGNSYRADSTTNAIKHKKEVKLVFMFDGKSSVKSVPLADWHDK